MRYLFFALLLFTGLTKLYARETAPSEDSIKAGTGSYGGVFWSYNNTGHQLGWRKGKVIDERGTFSYTYGGGINWFDGNDYKGAKRSAYGLIGYSGFGISTYNRRNCHVLDVSISGNMDMALGRIYDGFAARDRFRWGIIPHIRSELLVNVTRKSYFSIYFQQGLFIRNIYEPPRFAYFEYISDYVTAYIGVGLGFNFRF